MKTSCSLIIATYNWPEALNLVLLSIQKQTILPNEIIIADDGSSSKTQMLIADFQKIFSIPLIHVWHEDKGFRLAKIRNKAIKIANFSYIIQIDGDTILHKNFVKDHIHFSKPNTFLSGSRVLLNKEVTVSSQISEKIHFNFFSKGIKNRFNAVYFPFIGNFLAKPSTEVSKVCYSVRGCNMSFWKEDLLMVNGYNQEMICWGREDSEISVRLLNLGKIKENIKFSAIQYHQYHKESVRTGLNMNHQILENSIQEKLIFCKEGIEN